MSRPRFALSPSVPRIALAFALLAPLVACDDGYVARRDFFERQNDYLAFATATPINPGSTLNVLNHLERARRDRHYDVPDGAVPAGAWQSIFDKLYQLKDTSDFDLLYLNNLIEAYGGHPAVDAQNWADAKAAILGFKYWYSDPTPVREFDGEPVVDQMWYWTENHVLLFKVNEYLAGQRWPGEVFTVTGETGAWHRDRAAAEIRRWLEERARFGFAEWHSDVYYQKDLTPLLSLVEWAEDDDIAEHAAMVLDVLLLDMAHQTHRGNFGATHGRSYVKDKATAATQDVFHGLKLLFDDTDLPYRSTGAADASLLSRAVAYRMPRAIEDIARYDAPMTTRQRMNLPIVEEPDPDPAVDPPPAPYGLDYDDEANLPFWWSFNAMTTWNLVRLTLEVGERENLWAAQFSDFTVLRDAVWVEGYLDATVAAARPLLVAFWRAIDFALLSEVNTTTYRTADYMLSTAQDYRKGLRGSQTHISQATLDEHAVVFVQHPTYVPVAPGDPVPADWNWQREDEPGPGYWTGSAAEPRAAQVGNVSIQIFAPQYPPLAFLGFDYIQETHAYFPHAHFDEVAQEGGWTFGRKGDAYVGLWSHRPTEWRDGQPDVWDNQGLPFDLVAPGSASNVWIMELGSASEYGDFEAFRAALAAAAISATEVPDQGGDDFADGFAVVYASPGQGEIRFDWHGPLLVNGAEVPIADYPRFSSPFLEVEFDTPRYEVTTEDHELVLDFEQGLRDASRRRKPSLADLFERLFEKLGRKGWRS